MHGPILSVFDKIVNAQAEENLLRSKYPFPEISSLNPQAWKVIHVQPIGIEYWTKRSDQVIPVKWPSSKSISFGFSACFVWQE